ncbi:MAG: YifB family Mg chelatase-like AAA ATPase [Alistipes ihumii]
MFVKSHGSAVLGIDALPIAAEVNITAGIGMYLVGLPDNAVRESQERIRAAFENCSYKMSGKKVVVNLSPADIRKEGSAYDLTIALGILAATEQLPAERLSRYIVMGELSLDGSVLPVRGALPMALAARDKGFAGVILPRQNAPEAAVVSSIDVYGISHLREVVDFLRGDRELEPVQADTQALLLQQGGAYEADFSDVKGQRVAKRALEIAAAGGHNVLMIGSPGSGKTMLVRRLPSIMPPMTLDEALETTKIHSVAGRIGAGNGLIGQRPFRSPHHLTSRVALIGGGSTPQPGEISLAHNGVLFLDELPEFGRTLIETLRQPMEEGRVTVSRAKYTVEYPADFMLIAAMNPCPCGYYGHPSRECVCSQSAVYQYMNRISGPVLDRIDLHVHVSPLSFSELYGERPEESSATIRLRVVAARATQQARFAGLPIHCNASMGSKQIRAFCPLPAESETMLRRAMERMHLSARAYDRIVKVARTIADLAGEARIAPAHIAEAIRYRSLDRESAR